MEKQGLFALLFLVSNCRGTCNMHMGLQSCLPLSEKTMLQIHQPGVKGSMPLKKNSFHIFHFISFVKIQSKHHKMQLVYLCLVRICQNIFFTMANTVLLHLQVERLMALCPVLHDLLGTLRLDCRGQNAIIALGVYLLESGLQVHFILVSLFNFYRNHFISERFSQFVNEKQETTSLHSSLTPRCPFCLRKCSKV